MLKPHKLNVGDKVAIVSLSRGVLGEPFCAHQITLGVKRLEALGLVPVFMPNALKGVKYLADNPEARALDLKIAYFDDTIKAIICAIGGNDTYRILPYLINDEAFIQKVRSNPKIFLGFSDSTNNHLFFYKLGIVTYYGVNFLGDLAELDYEMLPYSLESFKKLFINPATTSISSSPVWYEERKDFSVASLNTPRIAHKEERGYEVLRGSGLVSGTLLGGCLDTFATMLDPLSNKEQYELYKMYDIVPDSTKWYGKILFLETSENKVSGDEFSRILSLLIDANIIPVVSAIIFGKPQDEHNYDVYNEILLQKTKPFNTPILVNVNFGHALPHALIPYGLRATIDFDNKTFAITEPFFK